VPGGVPSCVPIHNWDFCDKSLKSAAFLLSISPGVTGASGCARVITDCPIGKNMSGIITSVSMKRVWMPLDANCGRGYVVRRVTIVWLFVALVLMAHASTGRAQSSGAAQQTKEVQMTAKKYEFSPDAVEVSAGTKIIFKITSLDREHGFEIENSKAGCVKIKKGETATVEYMADKAGTVVFSCCVYCGSGHHGMKGKIVIR
jgi:cytochrome c oxidase subunit II